VRQCPHIRRLPGRDLMAAGAVDTGPMLGPPFALDQFPRHWPGFATARGTKIQVAPGS